MTRPDRATAYSSAIAPDRNRSSRTRTCRRASLKRGRGADPGVRPVLEEIERLLDTPLAELMHDEQERARADELTRQADAAPAIARFREILAFVGNGPDAGRRRPAS